MEEASRRIKKDWMRDCLHMWILRQGWEPVLERIEASTAAAAAAAASVLGPLETSASSSPSFSEQGAVPVSPNSTSNPPLSATPTGAVANGSPVVQET
jgi:hypothetical protein